MRGGEPTPRCADEIAAYINTSRGVPRSLVPSSLSDAVNSPNIVFVSPPCKGLSNELTKPQQGQTGPPTPTSTRFS